mmetsp:Transcript_45417/g.86845  ORF Transcript_45417/g.86845 Transcript_45417/m.86845 type:complete len:209 (-) Transcript_45417:29-655(-)
MAFANFSCNDAHSISLASSFSLAFMASASESLSCCLQSILLLRSLASSAARASFSAFRLSRSVLTSTSPWFVTSSKRFFAASSSVHLQNTELAAAASATACAICASNVWHCCCARRRLNGTRAAAAGRTSAIGNAFDPWDRCSSCTRAGFSFPVGTPYKSKLSFKQFTGISAIGISCSLSPIARIILTLDIGVQAFRVDIRVLRGLGG